MFFGPNFVHSWICLLGKNSTTCLFSVAMHFTDVSSNEDSKYLQCFFLAINSKFGIHRPFVFMRGTFFTPSGRFSTNNLSSRKAAKIILSNNENPIQVCAKFLFWKLPLMYFILCPIRLYLGLSCLKTSMFVFVLIIYIIKITNSIKIDNGGT